MRYHEQNHIFVVKLGVVDEKAEKLEVKIDLLLDDMLFKTLDK